MFLKMFSSNKF